MGKGNITERQKQVLNLLTDQYKTPKQVQSRLKISKTAFYKHLNKLKEKGLIIGNAMGGFTKPNLSHMGGVLQKPSFRLHDMELNLKLATTSKYKGRTGFWKGTRFKIFKTTIRVWQKDKHFYSDNVDDCYKQASIFFKQLIYYISQKYKIAIQSYEISHMGEIEEVDSETAKAVNKKGERWQFRGKDNKVWLETDKSLKRNNTETKHTKTSKEDAEQLFEGIHNSWREGSAYLPQQATDIINQILKIQLNAEKKQEVYAENMKAHAELIKRINRRLDAEERQRSREGMKDVNLAYKQAFNQEWW